VTSFTTRRCSIQAYLSHSVIKLTLVRVGMASGAGPILKSVKGGVFRLWRRSFLVAIATGHGDVSSGKHEPGLLMLRQGERGGPVSIQRVALLASVQVRRGILRT
jgi:hypothetical protein